MNIYSKILCNPQNIKLLLGSSVALASLTTPQNKRQKSAQKEVYVVSNSLPVKKNGEIRTRPGGLGTGVNPAFGPNTPWFKKAWIGVQKEENRDSNPEVNKLLQEATNQSLREFGNMEFCFLPTELVSEFYSEATNGVFWPLHHGIYEHVLATDKADVYRQVNEAMADATIAKIKSNNNGNVPEGSLVWVQDYHLQSTPKFLKEKSPQLKVGYVHHIPFEEISKATLEKFPQHKNIIKDSIEGMLSADTISFHTEEWKNNFLKSLENLGMVKDRAALKEVESRIIVNPIGIPKEEISQYFNELLTPLIPSATEGVPFTDETMAVVTDFDRDPTEHSEINVHEQWNSDIAQQAITKHSEKVVSNNPLEYTPFPDETMGSTAESEREYQFKPDGVLLGNLELDPEKINVGALSRLDYTKGILNLVEAWDEAMHELERAGVKNPGEHYQLNIVASSPRDIPAYIEYQSKVREGMKNVLGKFPGSLTFIDGVDFNKLPINNAPQDIIIAPSTRDGYLMAAVEALHARNEALSKKGLIANQNRPSALIISKGAGVSESLKKPNIPEALSIIPPTKQEIKNALLKQIKRIEEQRSIPAKERRNNTLDGFMDLAPRINTAELSANRGLEFLLKSKNNSPRDLTRSESSFTTPKNHNRNNKSTSNTVFGPKRTTSQRKMQMKR